MASLSHEEPFTKMGDYALRPIYLRLLIVASIKMPATQDGDFWPVTTNWMNANLIHSSRHYLGLCGKSFGAPNGFQQDFVDPFDGLYTCLGTYIV